ncbi:hypothetical protein ACN1T8_002346 [Vibrio cholerae]|uniref:hypothetical protein n=1 Tax=Vibrio cholerae TaxID=666 RepID=UPI001C92E8E0|nr:hypothetical protein [Vibrio cholerae]MBY4643448.1 hypothetical protein [Vibrio cholerae]MCR9658655.1 hypothetical protein [Vibrio cholerae]MCR9689335.1 hypothetical protein [Vibrio cholerae]MCR9738502.1 hypothetical protein [Vibrio cholerae]MCR9746667.1 hypothetical protein [Vibrio cholerae]
MAPDNAGIGPAYTSGQVVWKASYSQFEDWCWSNGEIYMVKVTGKVKAVRALSFSEAILDMENVNESVHLKVSQAWIINRGDIIVVIGKKDNKTGVFCADAYKNLTNGVISKTPIMMPLLVGLAMCALGAFFYMRGVLFLGGAVTFLGLGAIYGAYRNRNLVSLLDSK